MRKLPCNARGIFKLAGAATRPLKCIVSGGGIGGLGTALLLHQAGHQVKVLESARDPLGQEVGAGINIQPHGTQVMFDLGLGEKLYDISARNVRHNYYSKYGQKIVEIPKTRGEDIDKPQDNLLVGHRGVGYEQDGRTVRLEVQDRNTDRTFWEEGDCLLGVDGIHSAIRGQMFPKLRDVPHQPSGLLMYRGVTMMEPYLDGQTMFVAGSVQANLVVYPIAECQYSKGLQLVNWVAIVECEEANSAKASYGATVDDPEEVLKYYKDFELPFLNHEKLIGDCKHIFKWPMVDRDPLPKWTDGRVALLGDSAHPMYPVGANGGSTALQDAAFLAAYLKGAPNEDVPRQLKAYEETRLPATTAIQMTCRRNTMDHVMNDVRDRIPRHWDVPEEYAQRWLNRMRVAQQSGGMPPREEPEPVAVASAP